MLTQQVRLLLSLALTKLSSVLPPSSRLLLCNYPECFLRPPLHTFLQRISCSPPIWRVAKIPTSPPGGAGSSRPTPTNLEQSSHSGSTFPNAPARSPTPQRPTACQRFCLKSSQSPPVSTSLSSSTTLTLPLLPGRLQFERRVSDTLQEAAKSPSSTFLTLFLSVHSLEVFPGHPFRKDFPV